MADDKMLARIPSDPETGVPRSRDFGLDSERIQSTLVTPPLYVTIALLAGDVDPDRRPPFTLLHTWLDRLLLCLDAHLPVSLELQMEVQEFVKNAENEVDGDRLLLAPHRFLRAASAPFFDVGSVDSGCGDQGEQC